MPRSRPRCERWIALSLGAVLSIAAFQAGLGVASLRGGAPKTFQLAAQDSGPSPTTFEPTLDPRRWSDARRTGSGLAPATTGLFPAPRTSPDVAERRRTAWRTLARRTPGARAPPR